MNISSFSISGLVRMHSFRKFYSAKSLKIIGFFFNIIDNAYFISFQDYENDENFFCFFHCKYGII